MALTATVINRAPLPAVRLTATVPNGRAWTITASGADTSWEVASGVSAGQAIILADPMAPLNAPVSYTLSHGTSRETTTPVTRTYAGWDVIADLSGREVVDFIRPHEDSTTYEPRAEFFTVPGRATQPALYDLTSGAPTGSISARVAGPDLKVMKSLIMANKPLIVLHNVGRCPLPGCDLEPAMTVFFESASNNLSPRKDRVERIWDLSYRVVDQAADYLAPVVLWADVENSFNTWGDVAALSNWGAVEGGGWIAN